MNYDTTYDSFNQFLFSSLNQGATEAVAAASGFDGSVLQEGVTFSQDAQSSGTGTLVVQATLANGAIPVEGAVVYIFNPGERTNPLATLRTDRSGRTEGFALAAPSASYSQTPNGTVRPYSVYDIRVESPGFYTATFTNIPVFDAIVSVQPVALIPLAEGSVSSEEVNIDETTENNL